MNDETEPVGQSSKDSLFEYIYGPAGLILLNLFGIPVIVGGIAGVPTFIEALKSGDTAEKILAIGVAGLIGIIGVGTVTIDLQAALRLLSRDAPTTE